MCNTAAEQMPPPTLKQVAALVGVTDSILKYRYPDLCEKITARASERKALELERQRREFLGALDEPILPTAEALSARIGIGLTHFGRIHPDLYARYRERSVEARRLGYANRRAVFEAEIRSAAIELIDRGLYLSRRRILLAIPNPSMRHLQILSRQVASICLKESLLEQNDKIFDAIISTSPNICATVEPSLAALILQRLAN